MVQVSRLSAELSRRMRQLARALLVAARSWTLYPPEHPTLAVSLNRLAAAIRESSLGAAFSLGVTKDTLRTEGMWRSIVMSVSGGQHAVFDEHIDPLQYL